MRKASRTKSIAIAVLAVVIISLVCIALEQRARVGNLHERAQGAAYQVLVAEERASGDGSVHVLDRHSSKRESLAAYERKGYEEAVADLDRVLTEIRDGTETPDDGNAEGTLSAPFESEATHIRNKVQTSLLFADLFEELRLDAQETEDFIDSLAPIYTVHRDLHAIIRDTEIKKEHRERSSELLAIANARFKEILYEHLDEEDIIRFGAYLDSIYERGIIDGVNILLDEDDQIAGNQKETVVQRLREVRRNYDARTEKFLYDHVRQTDGYEPSAIDASVITGNIDELDRFYEDYISSMRGVLTRAQLKQFDTNIKQIIGRLKQKLKAS